MLRPIYFALINPKKVYGIEISEGGRTLQLLSLLSLQKNTSHEFIKIKINLNTLPQRTLNVLPIKTLNVF